VNGAEASGGSGSSAAAGVPKVHVDSGVVAPGSPYPVDVGSNPRGRKGDGGLGGFGPAGKGKIPEGGGGDGGDGGGGGGNGEGGGGGGTSPEMSRIEAMFGKMSSDMKEVKSSCQGVETSVKKMQDEILNMKTDIEQIKKDMCTQEQFAKLEERIKILETRGPNFPQMDFLRQSMSKLDPAKRSLAFRNFADNDLTTRVASIDACLAEIGGGSAERMSVEHIYKGEEGKRTPAGLTIIEFRNHDIREHVLKTFNDSESSFKDRCGNKIEVSRAKTAAQRQRNSALKNAKSAIEKHAAGIGKSVVIDWQIPDSKDRSVSVDGVIAFKQIVSEACGTFVGQFTGLHL